MQVEPYSFGNGDGWVYVLARVTVNGVRGRWLIGVNVKNPGELRVNMHARGGGPEWRQWKPRSNVAWSLYEAVARRQLVK